MKTYKQLIAEGVINPKNIPEGAMWVAYSKDGEDTNMYYKVQDGELLVCWGSWSWDRSTNRDIEMAILRETNYNVVPLPNIWIPWKATEDSVSPVPGDMIVQLSTGAVTRADNVYWHNKPEADTFEAYKIIDKEFIKSPTGELQSPEILPIIEIVNKPETTTPVDKLKTLSSYTIARLDVLYTMYHEYKDVPEVKECLGKEMVVLIETMLQDSEFYGE